ncbi:MAG: FAD-binding oxidoreductase, partial [Alphaproteobacteria bacterium]|nr:FAD-binding oxidoreductase [Alphaproteobacteria bacterium]
GVTLAVDFPNRAKAAALIGELEEMALAAGGRIYLAKDSLASGAMIATMYPELPEFQRIANNADKDHQFETDLTRRLNLRGAL